MFRYGAYVLVLGVRGEPVGAELVGVAVVSALASEEALRGPVKVLDTDWSENSKADRYTER
ncbi:hypothetical protein GCM10009646_87020 [Streptomyces aureus]